MTFDEWYETLSYKYTPLIKELMKKAWEESERYAYCRARQDKEDIDNGRWE